MELFEFIKVMITDPRKYNQLKSSDKGRNHFMVQRFMSIKFPTTAQQLNRVGISGAAVMDLWQKIALRFNGRIPGWIYTKTKKSESSTNKTFKPNAEAAAFWMQRNGLTERDLKDAIQFNPEEMKKILSSIEKQIKMYD
jgi:hypothetical protein